MNHIRLLIRNQCGSHIIHGIPNSLAFQQNYSRYDGPSESGSFLTLSKPGLTSFLSKMLHSFCFLHRGLRNNMVHVKRTLDTVNMDLQLYTFVLLLFCFISDLFITKIKVSPGSKLESTTGFMNGRKLWNFDKPVNDIIVHENTLISYIWGRSTHTTMCLGKLLNFF